MAAAASASLPAESFVTAAGAAVFHVATARVVVVSVPDGDGGAIHFLPKGRRDVGEDVRRTAEREAYEESGFRCRLLPLPVVHRQPGAAAPLNTEPVWLQLVPMQGGRIQYVLQWFVAETVPAADEAALSAAHGDGFAPAPPYPTGLALRERCARDAADYEPVRHLGTGTDEREREYSGRLVDVAEARRLLAWEPTMASVVERGWAAISARLRHGW